MADSDHKDVFISYATKDGAPYAAALRTALEAEGVTVWQDVIQLPRHVGEDWWAKITGGIDHVNYVIMVVTPETFNRDTVQKEWRYARRSGVCVLPIHASSAVDLQTVPRWMNRVQFAFLGYDSNADAIRAEKAWRAFVATIQAPCKTPRYPYMVDDLGIYIQRDLHFNRLIDLLLDKEQKNPRAITSALALKGAGGYGKTTLARAICHDERIESAFSDGILWVTLGETASMETVRAKLNVLVTELTGEKSDMDMEGAKSAFKSALENREILLVIDDVWKPEHLTPFLQGGETVARLITTRNDDVLPANAERVAVANMQTSEAARLIGYGFSADEQRDHAGDLRALAAQLGEYPLLLKLGNGLLHDRVRQHEPLIKALDFLKRSLNKRGVTKALKIENSDDRSRAVDATLRLSIDCLSDQQRAWFTRLAIFSDDTAIPLATLEKAWACDDLDVEDGCAALNRLSLLLSYDLAARTITLHDVIRAYLREQVIGGADKLTAANAAFLDAYHVTHWRDLPTDEPYLWEHLAYHLIEAARGDELITTVLDLRYLAAKTFRRGTAKVEADLQAAPQMAAVELLTRNFRNMGHILTRCVSVNDALSTLHTRLRHLDALQPSCEAVESELKPRIAPHHPLPDLPHPALIRTLAGHTDIVNSAAFSPDGRQIVSAADDGTVKVWDAASGVERLTLRGHTSSVTSAEFSPDGTQIVSASLDNTVKLWDAETGVERLTLEGHTDVTSVAFSPDGAQVVSAIRSAFDNMVKLWDVERGVERLTLELHTDWVTSVAFSPDGTQVVSAAGDNTVKLWDAASGVERLTLSGHTDGVNSAAFSLDGTQIISASGDNTVKLWDAVSGVERLTLHGHTKSVTSAAFSPDGTQVVSASNDKTVRLWDAASGVERLTLHGHTSFVTSAAFSPDGRQIVSASHDKTLKVWDAALSLLPRPEGEGTGVWAILTGHTDSVTSVAFSPDGTQVVSASWDGTVKLWDATSGAERLILRGHTHYVSSATFSPDGRQIGSASWDGTVKLWDAANGVERLTLTGHTNGVNSAAFSPDGRWIVSASHDNTIKLWDADSGVERLALTGHTHIVTSAAFSPDRTQVVSASWDGTVKLWDATSGAERLTLRGHTHYVSSAAFSSDGTQIVSAAWDETVKLCDAASGVERLTLRGHTESVRSAAFSPDGRWIVSASDDRTLKVWDAQTGVCRATFYADVLLWCCAWSPDGNYIVAGGQGGYLYWLRWVE